MKKIFGFLTTMFLVVTLSACTNPQADFDAAIQNVKVSLEAEDFDLAEAYLETALELFPESPIALEMTDRVSGAKFSSEVLQETTSLARRGDWQAAFESATRLSGGDANFDPSIDQAGKAIELELESLIKDEISGEEQQVALEEIIIYAQKAEGLGYKFIPKSLRAAQTLGLAFRTGQIESSLAQNNDQEAMDQVSAISKSGAYSVESLVGITKKVMDEYVKGVLTRSRKLTQDKKLDEAYSLIIGEQSKLSGNLKIQNERERVATLIQDETDRMAKEENAEKQRALNAMLIREDTFENIKWYYDRKTYSQYAGDKFLLYMGQRANSSPWLQLRFMMKDSDWHFFERIILDVDGTKYNFNPGYSEVNRDNGSGDIWEWYDREPSQADILMIGKIIDSKRTRVRYVNDDNFYVERTITSAQKAGLKNVLLAYEALK